MKVSAPKKPAGIDEIPMDYTELCSNYLPRPIHDDNEYEDSLNAIQELMGFESRLTPGQTDYIEAISTFIEQYEKNHIKWPQTKSNEALSYLLHEHGMNGGDLANLLKMDPSMGNKILRGDRNLTVNHIRKLSLHFSVSPELFI